MSWRKSRVGGTSVFVRRASGEAPPDEVAPACHAPFVSMFLDQHGGVRACCQNAHYPLGYVTERPLSEIWHGVRARRLRRALEAQDFGFGCEFCAWQVDDGHPERAYARWYDDLLVDGPEPDWPQMLELSLSNTCNLQCVMCNGDWSSSIRAHREHRPPLVSVYDEAFFEDLRAFVPHLRRVNLLGGEPFLATETLRVIDLLIEEDSSARVSVTTNGTQWSPRVERILDRLPIDIVVSVDAATPATTRRYGRARVGMCCNVTSTISRTSPRREGPKSPSRSA